MTRWNRISVGAIELPHRLAMAPMTRDRSRADGVPTDLNREYSGVEGASHDHALNKARPPSVPVTANFLEDPCE